MILSFCGYLSVDTNFLPMVSFTVETLRAFFPQLLLAYMNQGQQQADANAAAEESEPFLGSCRLGMWQSST
jgi:hypothetical protein